MKTSMLGAVLSLATATTLLADAGAGETVFRKKAMCVACHATDGSGNTPAGKSLKAKDLRTGEVQKRSDTELATIISDGKGKMPSFGKALSQDDIRSVVLYLRVLARK
jgi:mono/diheme cytochrome c family protein